MSDTWFYTHAGTVYGPISTDQLLRLAATGGLRPDDRIWPESVDPSAAVLAEAALVFPSPVPAGTPRLPPTASLPEWVRALTDAVLEEWLVELRRQLRQTSDLGEYGAAALRREWLDRGFPDPPVTRTIHRILRRRGRLDGPRRQRRPAPPPGWYLTEVAARRVERDRFDRIEGLALEGGAEVQTLTAVSLHGGLAATRSGALKRALRCASRLTGDLVVGRTLTAILDIVHKLIILTLRATSTKASPVIRGAPTIPESKIDWHGVFPAATTQFHADQSLDLDGTSRHVDGLLQAGAHGIILLGTVGENCSLEYAEKLEVLRTIVRRTAGRAPVLSGVAEYTTALACRFAADAQKAGVDGLMVLPTMVYKSDPRETIAHFRAVARATDLPILCYNNPVSYAVDLTPPMFAEMADEARFVAVKESSENVRRITDLKNHCGDRYLLFCGVDDLVLESILLGAVGWVSGLVNAFPAESKRLWDLATGGRREEALSLYRWFTPLLHFDTQTKLVQYIKLAMAEVGLGSEMVRAPRLPLVGKEREDALAVIRKAVRTRPAK